MSVCQDCGAYTCVSYGKYDDAYLCDECYKKRNQDHVVKQSEELKEPSDFKSWNKGDMSELFWIHLGRYVKNPNEESFRYIGMAFSWACHDDYGLANSFKNAMDWVGFDMYTEGQRWRCKEGNNVR